jgi:hypothetical protein
MATRRTPFDGSAIFPNNALAHLEQDRGSSSDLHSVASTSSSGSTFRRRSPAKVLIELPANGLLERIRPIQLKNSVNGDYILCQTHRGNYVAHRTDEIPLWVIQLANEIDRQQR